MNSSKNVLTIQAVAMFALAVAPVQAEVIPVPNGSFETIYKPGSTTITADLGGGWTNGAGPDTPMNSGQTAAYSDGTTGTLVDVPGWINAPGWPPSYKLPVGAGSIARQQTPPDGVYYYLANGSNWGNPQGGAIESDAPLATVTTAGGDLSYTVSMLANGSVAPVLLELRADGVALTPSSSVDPAAPYGWGEFSRTYDAASLAGHLGESLTIRVGFGPDAVGTQSQIDKVSLSYVPGNAATFALTITPADSGYDLEWASRDGMLYNVWSTADLSEALADWDLVEGGIPATGASTTWPVTPAGTKLFYRVEEFPPPPVTLFAENFDATAGPGLPPNWSTGRNNPPDDGASTTNWEVGTPATVGPVPPGTPLPSGTQCVATGIASDYDDPATDGGTPHTDIWLRTAAIDLTGHLQGTLTFQQWTVIEDVTGDLDYGSIRILDASDNSELAVLDDRTIDGATNGWEAYSRKLPAAAFTATNGMIVIEFRFEADDLFSFAGWYIDDVAVTVPAASGNPYVTWAASNGLTAANYAPGDDPDKDGETNLYEFAFDGDPLAISDKGKVFGLTEDSDFDGDPDPELLLTVAVRAGTPVFSGSPSPTSTHDGITYTVEGSTILSSFPTPVNVVPTPLTTGLPATRSGYEYRSFSLAGSNGFPLIGFLRAQVTQP